MDVRLPDGSTKRLRLYAREGAAGLLEYTDRGNHSSSSYDGVKTHRSQDKRGRYREYNEYALPEGHEGKTVIVRLDTTDDDRARGFNRSENVRPISPTDPDFARLFARRNDIESINRGVDDSLYLGACARVGHTSPKSTRVYALVGNTRMLSSDEGSVSQPDPRSMRSPRLRVGTHQLNLQP
jgi:hypothetical protein